MRSMFAANAMCKESVVSSLFKSSLGAGILLVISSCLSLQLGASLANHLFDDFGAWGVTVMRLGLASLILLAIARPRVTGWSKQAWVGVILLGISLGGMNGFFFAAVERLDLSVAVAFEFSGPLVLAAVLSRKLRDVLWVAVAAMGMVLLAVESLLSGAGMDWLGVAFALIAGGFWAMYILCSARVGQQVPGTGGLAVGMTVAALVSIPMGITGAISGFQQIGFEPTVVAIIVGMALLSSVIPYSLELGALRRLPKPLFSVLLSLEPVFAALVGWVVLDQSFGWMRWIVIAFVISASIGTTRSTTKQSKEVTEDTLVVTPTGKIVDTTQLPQIPQIPDGVDPNDPEWQKFSADAAKDQPAEHENHEHHHDVGREPEPVTSGFGVVDPNDTDRS